MKVSKGAVLWMDGTPRPVSEIETSDGPLGCVRVELCVPISDIKADNGHHRSRTDILMLEMETDVAFELAMALLSRVPTGERVP